MAWVNVAKPTSSVWTRINPVGKEQYNDSITTFDSATSFYDGINQNAWTNVSKPITSSWITIAKPV